MTLKLEAEELRRRFRAAFAYASEVVSSEDISPDAWRARLDRARTEADLPLALSLIHPNVAPIAATRWQDLRGPRDIARYRSSLDTCQSERVWGYACPRPDSPLQLDHAWPWSLGGRSTPDNSVWLCREHNSAKSWDVHCYDWAAASFPEWLTDFLSNIERDVRGGRYPKFAT